jgi:phage/plasmid-associated DNA primase
MTTIANLKFTETFDRDKLAYLVDERTLDANAKAKAIAYLLASRDGCVDARYHQAARGGRWYADRGLSLQSLKREVRHTIAADKYQDIDMVNAQPTMIQHLCRKHKLVCPHLDEYVSNRDALLDALLDALDCSRDEAKAIYLTVMNGGSCDKAKQTPHLKAFKQEMRSTAQSLKATLASEFKEVKERRVAEGKSDNHDGAFVSILYQQLENQVLECMFEFFGSSRNCVLCFDGIMIPSDMDCNLEACQQHVLDKLKICVTLKSKPFDQALPLPADLAGTYDKYMARIPATLDVTNQGVAEHFIRCFKSLFLYNPIGDHKLCMWDAQRSLWMSDQQQVKAAIYNGLAKDVQADYVNRLPSWKARKAHDIQRAGDDKVKVKEINKEVDDTIRSTRQMKSDAFIKASLSFVEKTLIADTAIHKDVNFDTEAAINHYVQFRDQAFNLKTGQAEPRTKEMYVTKCLNYDYHDHRDEAKLRQVDRIFCQIFPDKKFREAFKSFLGSCLTGDTSKQAFLLLFGPHANNGKSTACFMFEKAFPIYTKQIARQALERGNSAFNKAISSLLGSPCRLVYFNELGQDPIDSTTFKCLIEASTLSVQPLYQHEQNFQPRCKFVGCCNPKPRFDSVDRGVLRRGNLIPCDSNFVDTDAEVDEQLHRYKRDGSTADQFCRPEWAMQLFHYLAPYAKQFYEKGLELPQECKSLFAKCVTANNPVELFFHECVKHAPGEKASKSEFVKALYQFKQAHHEPRVRMLEWKDILRALDDHGYTYDCKDRASNHMVKGVVANCRLVVPALPTPSSTSADDGPATKRAKIGDPDDDPDDPDDGCPGFDVDDFELADF